MSQLEWVAYTSFGIFLIVVPCFFYYLFLRFKKETIQDVLNCKQSVFDISKELYFLTQEKTIHDEKVNSFIVELKVPKGKEITFSNLSENLVFQEAKFKSLLAKEEFFFLCKERILELITVLQARYSKSIQLVMKLLRLNNKSQEVKEKKWKGIVSTLLSKTESNWPAILAELKEKCNSLKSNKNLLIHSFSSWEKEMKEKLLLLEKE
ncbi:hypothetical protein DNK47_02360 [Mycoplasma wenyonii]|uniref:Uncharacterized protein n=1 Tax=Mycoplasma wenyonii TaxID=65123 RepID=A0A328PTW9_9MOLU|nr:hypothetical protein [Mycoplasma wenyonii]RAO94931.1 hypothetical protein DNK47_02360 [Mycoplasma wenyonii]